MYETWWARLGSNQRPPPCESGALPLSYAPTMGSCVRIIATSVPFTNGVSQRGEEEINSLPSARLSVFSQACFRCDGVCSVVLQFCVVRLYVFD